DAGDVVEAIVAALARPALAGRVLDLAGPESLPRSALVRRAAALAGASGPAIVPIPLAAVRAFAALAERFAANPPLTRAMLEVLEHDDRVDPQPACAALGIALTPLDETLRRALAQARERAAFSRSRRPGSPARRVAPARRRRGAGARDGRRSRSRPSRPSCAGGRASARRPAPSRDRARDRC